METFDSKFRVRDRKTGTKPIAILHSINASWQTKKEGKGKNLGIVHYASDIETLADVVKQDTWDESTISNRADWIAKKL